MKQIIPLIRDGKNDEASLELKESLKTITRTHLVEEKKRVAAAFFESVAIPNTKGSVEGLHETLLGHGYKKTREVPGAQNPVGKITLHDYKSPINEDRFRIHHMIKNAGGEHVGWGHMKQKIGESRLHPVKTGTGTKSLSTYLCKLSPI